MVFGYAEVDVGVAEDGGFCYRFDLVAEFRKRASDALLVIKLKTPKDESVGLWFEVKDEEDKEWFEQRLKEDAFHRGLNHVVHSRMKEATECFKECLNSKNPEIVGCAEYNIEAISWYTW